MINTNNVQYSSMFSTLKNDNKIPAEFSASYAGGTIAAGGYVGPIRASTVMDNTNDISQVQVKMTGIESFYRILDGTFQVDYPTSGSVNYSIELMNYFSGGILYVDAYIINQSGGSLSMPAITFDCNASLFLAPF